MLPLLLLTLTTRLAGACCRRGRNALVARTMPNTLSSYAGSISSGVILLGFRRPSQLCPALACRSAIHSQHEGGQEILCQHAAPGAMASPAQLIRMSKRPCLWRIPAAAVSTDCWSVTSSCTTSTEGISRAAASPAGTLRQPIRTTTFWAARPLQISTPMPASDSSATHSVSALQQSVRRANLPPLPPVTRATRRPSALVFSVRAMVNAFSEVDC